MKTMTTQLYQSDHNLYPLVSPLNHDLSYLHTSTIQSLVQQQQFTRNIIIIMITNSSATNYYPTLPVHVTLYLSEKFQQNFAIHLKLHSL